MLKFKIKCSLSLFVGFVFSFLILSCNNISEVRKTNADELRNMRNNPAEEKTTHKLRPRNNEQHTRKKNDTKATDLVESTQADIIPSIISFSRTLIGTKYKWAGTTPAGFDCSGFIYYVFHEFGIDIPRVPIDIAAGREKLDINELQPGDFMYFKGRDISSKRIGHIAMVTEKTASGYKIIHSTSSRGVIEGDFPDNGYWSARYLFSTRLSDEELAQGHKK
jgi:cell wall-associated NlpC family hydrolase